MQQEKFLELLRQPEKLDKASLEQLRQLAARYPYSQPLRMLLAKNLQLQKNPDFERQVNQAAALAFDRRHFQTFMSGRTKAVSQPAPVQATTASPKSAPSSLKGWLGFLFARKRKAVPTATEEKPAATLPQQAETTTEQPVQQAEPPTEITRPTPRKHDELIDRFLKEEPRIKPRRELTSEENLAEKNLIEPEEIGTETLAMIFVKQGLHQKALDIYQKLSLKYPEKSSYFAEKINTIKNEINLKK